MFLRRHASAPLWLFLLFLTLSAVGCSGASYIRATVPDNPIKRVAQQAQQEWTVEQVDENTLHLRNTWSIHSVMSLGYSASHANLFYDPSVPELDLQYYFQTNQLMTLWLPSTLDAEPGFMGGALKPIMNQQIDDILKWSGATVTSRRAGSNSEPFAPEKK